MLKDPRLAWFLGLWRSAALRCDATPAYVTMLRPVTEVVGSKQRYYSNRFGSRPHGRVGQHDAAHRTRHPWLSAGLRALRDLLRDWTVPLFGSGSSSICCGEVRHGQRHPQGAPVHRPDTAPRLDHVGRHRRPSPAARHRRGELAALNGLADTGGDQTRHTRRSTRCGRRTPCTTRRRKRSLSRPLWRLVGRGTPAAQRATSMGGPAAPIGSRTACARWCRPPPGAGSAAIGRER